MARVRAPFVITIAAVAASLPACGGSTDSDGGAGSGGVAGSGGHSGSGGSGASSGSGGGAGCPSAFPTNGSACSLPHGTSCFFSQGACCPDWQASCMDGEWQAYPSSCNPPAPDPCPEQVPQAGSACGSDDPCANPYQYCAYEKCRDGSPRIVAECKGGAWEIAEANCLPPPCEGLSACECFARSDCKALSDTCVCPCDYMCPGTQPCDCACGGGQYLGCAPL